MFIKPTFMVMQSCGNAVFSRCYSEQRGKESLVPVVGDTIFYKHDHQLVEITDIMQDKLSSLSVPCVSFSHSFEDLWRILKGGAPSQSVFLGKSIYYIFILNGKSFYL